jgi:hypothetical protein
MDGLWRAASTTSRSLDQGKPVRRQAAPGRLFQKRFPRIPSILFTAGSAATGTYRGLKLWEAAVKEANGEV